MKKNRKVFHRPVLVHIIAVIVIGMYIAMLSFNIYYLCNLCKTQESRYVIIAVIAISLIFLVMFIIMYGIKFVQWVVVDENKITARNMFGKIREVTWAEVKEAREISIIAFSPFYVGYVVMFVDTKGGETNGRMSYNSKKLCIRIIAKREDLECLLQFKPDLKIVKYQAPRS